MGQLNEGCDRYKAGKRATRRLLEAPPSEISKIRNARLAEQRAAAAQRRAMAVEHAKLVAEIAAKEAKLQEIKQALGNPR